MGDQKASAVPVERCVFLSASFADLLNWEVEWNSQVEENHALNRAVTNKCSNPRGNRKKKERERERKRERRDM